MILLQGEAKVTKTYRSSRKTPTQEYVVPRSIPTAGAILNVCDVLKKGNGYRYERKKRKKKFVFALDDEYENAFNNSQECDGKKKKSRGGFALDGGSRNYLFEEQ